MTPCMQKVSYDCATCEVMIRRVLKQCLGLAVPSWRIAFKKASLHCKNRGFFFPTKEAPRCPSKLLSLRCGWKARLDIITHRDLCLSSAVGGGHDLIYMYKVACLGSCIFCLFFFLLVL